MDKDTFVAGVLKKLKTAKFPDYVKLTPEQIVAEAGKNPEVFIAGALVKKKPTVGQSKVGGKPHVEQDFEWPTEDGDEGAPLQFIAQFNLAELHPHDFEKQLPAKGMVWFFSIADGNRAYGGEIDDSTTKVLFSAAPGPLKPHAIPEALSEDEDATIEERVIEFGPTFSTPSTKLRDSGIQKAIEKAAESLGGRKGPVYVLNQRDGEKNFMLADLDMYAIARNAFGEGILGFSLTPEALEEGALDQAETDFSSGS